MQAPSSNDNQQPASLWWQWLSGRVWKGFGFLGTTLLLGLAINVTSTWLTSSKGILPFDSPLARFLAQWPLVLSIGCGLLFVAILAKILSREPTSLPPHSATTLQAQQNREQMLRRLRQSYSELSAQSLQGITRLELGLANSPDTVLNTTNLLLRQEKQSEQMLPSGTTIVGVYEQAAHELLILGEPGAGKSTFLYQLGLHLVEQAEQDEESPLPILLPLSSWAIKRRPLQEWIGEQLSSSLYRVPRQISQQWIQHEQILPLLDGLDEMEASARAACIITINRYHQEHLHPLVVCSRSTEYKMAAVDERLNLQRAVVVQPLTNQQITDTLIQSGKPLAALRSELKKNGALHDLARSPLLLSILVLTYQNTTVRDLPRKRPELQKQIFTSYVERMQRKGDTRRYPPFKTIAWLGWLAQEMRKHDQPIFFLEQLQPDWLSKRARVLYHWSMGLLGFLSGGLLFGWLGWLLGGLFLGLPSGLLGSLLGGLLFMRSEKIEPAEVLTWSLRRGLRRGGIVGLITALFFGLLNALPVENLLGNLLPRLLFGLLGGLLGSLLGGLLFMRSEKIEPAEVLTWVLRRGLRRGWVVGLIAALLFGLFTNQVIKNPLVNLCYNLIVALFVGLIGCLIGCLIGGFSGKQLIERHSLPPNGGIRRSAKNGLILLSGVLFTGPLIGGLLGGLTDGLLDGLRNGLIAGLIIGLVAALLIGLGAALQHYTLRFWLWRSHLFPLKAIPFLEDATARILLRRVGGGYSFTHRLLLDYFADLQTTTPTPAPHPVPPPSVP